MYLSTSHERDTTDDNVIGRGLWEKMGYRDYMGYDSTEVTIRIAPLKGDHVKMLYNGDVIESALAPHQDSAAPDFLIEPEDHIIHSVHPVRTFETTLLIESVERAQPPEIDPDWVF